MAQTLTEIFDAVLVRIRSLEARPRAPRSYYNLAVNAGFEVWSGGDGPFSASGDTINDTWKVEPGTTTLAVSKDTANSDDAYSAACAVCVVGGAGAYIYHDITGPFISPASKVAISARVRTATPSAVRVGVDGVLMSGFHTGSDRYETLTVVLVPGSSPWRLRVAFEAVCIAYVDNVMVVQGAAPIDYIIPTAQDETARIAAY